MTMILYDPAEKAIDDFIACYNELVIAWRNATSAEKGARMRELFSEPLTMPGSMHTPAICDSVAHKNACKHHKGHGGLHGSVSGLVWE